MFADDLRALSTSNLSFKWPLTDKAVANRANASKAVSDCTLASETVACVNFRAQKKQ